MRWADDTGESWLDRFHVVVQPALTTCYQCVGIGGWCGFCRGTGVAGQGEWEDAMPWASPYLYGNRDSERGRP